MSNELPHHPPEVSSDDLLAMIAHAVHPMLDNCANSYVNAYTEQWLTLAKKMGAYHGPKIGSIIEVKAQWESHLESNGLPDWEDKEDYYDSRG